MVARYIFGGDTGLSPEEVRRQREWAQRLMGSDPTPKNWGEGVGAIMKGFASRMTNDAANQAETAGREQANDVFGRLVSGITGGKNNGSQYVGPTSPPATGSAPTASSGRSNSTAVTPTPKMTGFNGSQAEFIEAITPGALAASERTGVDPRIIIAQAAHESGWGKHAPGNNLFGIKSHGKPGGQELWTTEEVNGQNVRIRDNFRAYENIGDSLSGYADFILENPRYKPFMAAGDLDSQLSELGRSGYATDSNYLNSVGSIARGINLPSAPPTQVASLDPGFSRGIPPANGNPAPSPGMTQGLPPGARNDDPGINAQLPPLAPPGNARASMQAQTPPSGGQPPMQQPPIQTAQGPSIEELMQAASNPWLDESQRAMIGTMLEQQLQQQDPAYQQQMQMNNLSMQQMQQQIEEGNYQARPMSPEEMASWGIPPESGSWGMGPDNTPVQLYEAPAQAGPEYDWMELPDGTVARTDATSGAFEPVGNFAEQAEPGFRSLGQDEVTNMNLDPNKAWQVGPDNRIYEVGGTGVTVNNNMGEGLSPGWEAIDKAFADTYLSWTGGGSADTQAQLSNLDNALGLLESGQAETGNITSLLPRDAQAFLNSDGLIARENVEETVQRSLRETLGAQFTEREGERLIQRAFNPALPTSENIRRVNLLVGKITEMAQAKDAMADYFRQNGSLMGYEGLTPTMSDLVDVESEFGEDPSQDGAQPNSASPQQPNQSQANPEITDGAVIQNDTTGQRMILRNGEWQELM